MNKQDNTQEFSLEDILREFSDHPEEIVEIPDVELPEQALPDAEDPVEQAPVEAVLEEVVTPEPEVPSEEPRMPELKMEEIPAEEPEMEVPEEIPVKTAEETLPETLEELTTAVEGGPLPEQELPEQETEEPAQLEQEAETVTKPPIVLRSPRSRLQELKHQLVAGPEKRYYDLTSIGLGRVQAAIWVNLLVVLLCAGATAMFAMGMVPENRLRLMVFSQVLAMLVSALLGCYVLMDGIGDLLKLKFSINSMLFITFVVCCVDAVFCLRQLRVPCCAAFSLEMTMALWNRYLGRYTELGQMDTLRKAIRLDSVIKVPDYYEGRPGVLRSEGNLADFMDNYKNPTGPEKVQKIYALISLLVCTGIAALAYVRHGISLAIQIYATSLLVAIPATYFITLSRPMAILERRLHMVGTVLCGWQGVKGLCGRAVVPLRDGDLFPNGATKLNGVKFYGSRNPDETVSYAASLITMEDEGLAPVFRQMIKSRNGIYYDVDNLTHYPSGGLGGEVRGEPVLMGSLQFLQDMGVEIPEGTMVNQAVYCAIDGQLAAVFAISYAKMKSAAAGLVTLCGYRKLTPVVICGDFMVDESFLRSKFGINTRRFAFPDQMQRRELRNYAAEEEPVALAMTTQENLASVAYAVSGARALRTACKLGMWVHIISGVIGMLIMLALAILGSVELLTPFNVLMYQLIWVVPGILISTWTRTV